MFVAHFGSAESLRLIAVDRRGLPLSILLDRKHGRMLTELLEELNPELARSIIDASERGPQLVLTLKEAVQAGRMLGIMVDRALATDRTVAVDFLGGRARFPVGPWQMAHALQVPIILGFGVYHGGNRYTAHFELFAESPAPAARESRSRHRERSRSVTRSGSSNTCAARRTTGSTSTTTGSRSVRPIMNPLRISTYTVSSAVGAGRAAHVRALRAGTTGLGRLAFDTNTLDCWLGEVRDFDVPLTGALADWDCRNNRLAEFALSQDQFLDAVAACRERYGAARIGVFIGTSTSGVQHTELAYRARDAADERAARMVRPAPHAEHFLGGGVRRAAPRARRPGAGDLDGLLIERESVRRRAPRHRGGRVRRRRGRRRRQPVPDYSLWLQLAAAHLRRHLPARGQRAHWASRSAKPADSRCSIRRPRARWRCSATARPAMRITCLRPSPRAGAPSNPCARRWRAPTSRPREVDYINLHGTGTIANDNAESRAVCEVFGTATPCSSTKGWTGHTLGAAGMVEAAISLLAIEQGFMPRSLNTRTKDPAIEAGILLETRVAPVRRVLSNSFGFGGSNCSLLFGRLP